MAHFRTSLIKPEVKKELLRSLYSYLLSSHYLGIDVATHTVRVIVQIELHASPIVRYRSIPFSYQAYRDQKQDLSYKRRCANSPHVASKSVCTIAEMDTRQEAVSSEAKEDQSKDSTMVGAYPNGYSNESEYYLVQQHRIFRAYLHDMVRIDNEKTFEASSKLSLHEVNFRRSIEVRMIHSF